MNSKSSNPFLNLPNLGPKSSEMLRAAGISSVQQLQSIGATDAFLMVFQAGYRPSLNLLWALAAGLQNRHWNDLSTSEKADLKRQLQSRGFT